MLKINNVSIAVPSAFQVDIQDIDGESNRNARGELLRENRIDFVNKTKYMTKIINLCRISLIMCINVNLR